MLFEGQICCHSTGLQAGREEDVNPEGGKTTIVALTCGGGKGSILGFGGVAGDSWLLL